MKLIESPQFYGIRNPNALARFDENGYQVLTIFAGDRAVGITEADLIALALNDEIDLYFMPSTPALEACGMVSVGVKVL